MRIATWNVNSLKARQDAVEKWLLRADPDVLLMQETKLPDQDAPVLAVAAHEGQKRATGEPYVTHPIASAQILAELGIDTIAITTRMGESVSAYVQDAMRMGTEIPAAMRPMLEAMAARFSEELDGEDLERVSAELRAKIHGKKP